MTTEEVLEAVKKLTRKKMKFFLDLFKETNNE
jgi:hypothetical protein